jgi:tetratricopeptide (TPR) repeat protein
MKTPVALLVTIIAFCFSSLGQTAPEGSFRLVLLDHRGQLSWTADGFKVVQYSAKAEGREIGIRGKDQSGYLTFLGFLFLVPEKAPLTGARCRDGAVDQLKKGDPKLEVAENQGDTSPGGLPIAMASYTAQGRNGKKVYSVRGFIAARDICGDLEVYSDTPISADETTVKKIFASYRLDEDYVPQFADVLLYAQILYKTQMYKAAGPAFEIALASLKKNPDDGAKVMKDEKTARRVLTDQAGMAYGMSGDITKARSLFEKAIVEDPDYPLNYYNLACADAEAKNLADARRHLQQAFARKANVIAGETMPDPTKDDSFLAYRDNKEFWTFLRSLWSQ